MMDKKTKIILGIHAGHNASAALIIDGKVVGAIAEEKFDNIKNSGGMPIMSIKWLINEFNIDTNHIDGVCFAGEFLSKNILNKKNINNNETAIWYRKNKKFIDKFIKFIKIFILFYIGKIKFLRNIFIKYVIYKAKKSSNKIKEEIYNFMYDQFKITKEKLYFIPHHDAHAFASYFSLNKDKNEKALIFTLDGAGDDICSAVYIVDNGNILKVASTRYDNSIGSIYGVTTEFLGMKSLEHEYKVMGLAPYAKSYYLKTYENIFKNLIYVDSDTLQFKSKFITELTGFYLEKNALYERFDNIAGSLQKLTEDSVIKWVLAGIKKYGINNCYFGGGVFMNIKLNMKISLLDEIQNCHFLGSCGDESNSIGAAYNLYYKLFGINDINPLSDFYLGIKYTNNDVSDFINNKKLDNKYKIEYFDDIEKEIAKLLSEGKVVARFKGRCEWGARALGNRSILADPSKMESFYIVNDQIKMRDFWMPFAPSILFEDQHKYIINPKNYDAPYMILGFNSTKEAQKQLCAAIHQADKTLRPQVVKKETNPSYYNLISEFKNITGIGAVLNTSMNLHGYPLVATLEQALFTFENSGLKYIALENYLISKI